MIEASARPDLRHILRSTFNLWRERFALFTTLGLAAGFFFPVAYFVVLGSPLMRTTDPTALIVFEGVGAWLAYTPIAMVAGIVLNKALLDRLAGFHGQRGGYASAVGEAFWDLDLLNILLSGGYYVAGAFPAQYALALSLAWTCAMFQWSLAGVVSIAEDLGFWRSLARSAELTRPYGATMLVIWLVLDLIGWGLQWLAWPQMFGSREGNDLSYWFLSPLASSFWWIVVSISTVVLYGLLREAEGTSLQSVFD